jgi:ribonucleoside-diphosphate reductase alpha chain
MPANATLREIKETYIRAWELGLKCVTIYRAGSKMSEPLRVKEIRDKAQQTFVPEKKAHPDDVDGPRHKFTVGGHTGYIHVGLDPETNRPLEIFIRMAGHGSVVGGLLDGYGKLFSKALQYNIPLEQLVTDIEGSNFPPSGITANKDIPMAKSILDYIAKWLTHKYVNGKDGEAPAAMKVPDEIVYDLSTDTCPECGHNLRQAGRCLQCNNCSYNSGVCS